MLDGRAALAPLRRIAGRAARSWAAVDAVGMTTSFRAGPPYPSWAERGCRKAWSLSIDELTQPPLHLWPLRRHDRKAHRIASDVVRGHPMSSENPFVLATDA